MFWAGDQAGQAAADLQHSQIRCLDVSDLMQILLKKTERKSLRCLASRWELLRPKTAQGKVELIQCHTLY